MMNLTTIPTEISELLNVLPITPVGWRMVVWPKEVKEQTAGGIILPRESQQYENVANTVGLVIAQGDTCYQHPKFQGDSWCGVGDWVMYPKLVGRDIEIKTNDKDNPIIKFRVINDDEVIVKITDPELVRSYVA